MKFLKKSFGLLEVRQFAFFTILWFFLFIFLNSSVGAKIKGFVFYINAIGAVLCLVLLLKDVWDPDESYKKTQFYLWYLVFCICLPFLSAFIFVRGGYSFIWFLNFILANILLYFIVRNYFDFIILCVVGVSLGFITGKLLDFYMLKSEQIHTNLAFYSGSFFLARIALVAHNRTYVQKHIYSLIEKEIKDRTKALQDALEIKTEFLDNVSHEIKTPVHNITNIISVLHDYWENLSEKDKRESIAVLKHDNARLLSLCSNLLDLSKFEKGYGISKKKCKIKSILDKISEEYKMFSDLISIKTAPEVQLSSFILCDYQKILQVIRNLVNNAIKYGNKTDIDIMVADDGSNFITFSVSDKGIGIPEKELKNIFNPFEQSSRTKTRAGGVGLGLAICKKIMEYHDGKVWAKNNKGKGATFFFTVPKYIKGV